MPNISPIIPTVCKHTFTAVSSLVWFTHIGIVTGLDGVVALQLSTGPIGVTLGTSQIAHTIMIRHFHGLPRGPALHMFRF